MIVDDNGGLKNVAVWVDVPAAATSAEEEAEPAVLDQLNWTFLPHVLAVHADRRIQFLNSDSANHNIHSKTVGHEFNIGTPVGNLTTRRFRCPTGTRPVKLECDIHDWMRAWIYVFPHEMFAVTAADGTFRINDVPSGTWRFHAHHPDSGLTTSHEVSIRNGEITTIELEVKGSGR